VTILLSTIGRIGRTALRAHLDSSDRLCGTGGGLLGAHLQPLDKPLVRPVVSHGSLRGTLQVLGGPLQLRHRKQISDLLNAFN